MGGWVGEGKRSNPTSATDSQIRALFADDPDRSGDLAAALERREAIDSVRVVPDVDAVLSAVAEGRVDCVLSEYDLPAEDGIDLLRTVRESDPEFPFFLVTNCGDEAVASAAISADVTDYVPRNDESVHECLSERVVEAVHSYREDRRPSQAQRVDDVVREVDRALVRASTREEIDRAVCEILADSDTYRFAWIGERDDAETIRPRASAGVEDGYLDEISVTARDDEKIGRGPAGNALRTGEIQVMQNVRENPAFEPWREEATERGYRSCASVPLTFGGTTYGLLNVYSGRPYAFDAPERELLADLGDTVAHAVDAVRTRERLQREKDRFQSVIQSVEEYAIFTLDPEGRVTSWNAGAEQIKGYAEDEILGEHLSTFYPEDAVEDGLPRRALSVAAEEGSFEDEGWRLRADGSRFWAKGTITALREDDGSLRGFAKVTRDLTDRHERERKTAGLQSFTRDLFGAESVEEIAVDAAEDVLGFQMTGVYLRDVDAVVALVPVAMTDAAQERFGYDVVYRAEDDHPSSRTVWRAFESGATLLIEDTDDHRELSSVDRPSRSAIVHPLGDHGVFITSSTDPGAFDDTDVTMAEMLADSVTAALSRAERERLLRERERELERQNDRLERFASVVSHDLRSPIEAAYGHLELLEHGEDPQSHVEGIRDVLDRMDALIEDVLTLARLGESIGDTDPVPLAELARTTWESVPGDDASLRVDGDPGVVEADRSRLRQLLENLFRNSVEHGFDDRTSGLTVRVGALEEGFYVADDGAGIAPDDRERVFDDGYSTACSTGFGLSIVREIADAHGWRVELTDSEAGGARFEFRPGE